MFEALPDLFIKAAFARDMEFTGQFTDTSHVQIAKYFPLVALAIIIYFLFFYKK